MKVFATALVGSVSLFACGDDNTDDIDDPVSIVDTAQATPELSTLVAAVEFASDNGDLVDLLAEPNTLTVFAPTNSAFDALAVELTGNAGATGADLLTAENKPLLRTVLQYHVLTSEVRAAEIPFGLPITTAETSIFKIEDAPPTIVDGRNREARITATDIEASNGVIHLIDKVILPSDKNIVELAQASAPEFSILVEAVIEAGLDTTLSGPGPFTVFAPTDAAFAALLVELDVTKEELFADPDALAKVLTYHVVGDRVLAAQVPIGTPIVTVETGELTVDGTLTITDENERTSNIVTTDLFATNGVIHVIDKVLRPE
jgi:uncharacterized surface protein with fasciclin (FAS1) repeats